jgi:hypothetical protein
MSLRIKWAETDSSLQMAGAAGFEPATYGFGDRRSTS